MDPVVARPRAQREHGAAPSVRVRHHDVVREGAPALRRLLRCGRFLRFRHRRRVPRLQQSRRVPRLQQSRRFLRFRHVRGCFRRRPVEGDADAAGRGSARRLRPDGERKRQLASRLRLLAVSLHDAEKHRVRGLRENEKAERRDVGRARDVRLDLRLARRGARAVDRFRDAVPPRDGDPRRKLALAPHDDEADRRPFDRVSERILDPNRDRGVRGLARHDRVHGGGNGHQRRRRRADLRASRVPARGGEHSREHPREYGPSAAPHRDSTFQKAMPPACLPTSTLAARTPARRSITSTVPGSPPTPSTLTKA